MHKKHYWLYVLKLKDNKYYVGITTKTPEIRFLEHKNGVRVARWVALHPPLSIYDRKDLGTITETDAKTYENKVVRSYIKKYGIKNVRGGDLSYTEDLVIFFGTIRNKELFVAATVILFLLCLVAYLIIRK